jgi:hypothetical protein
MRRVFGKAYAAGVAVVIVTSVLLPWAWREARRARQQPPPQYAAST